MKILVTGSEGSLAQMVIPRLMAEGHSIVGVDNFARYGHIKRDRPYEFHTGDLCDTAIVKRLYTAHRFDCVYHFAALVYGVVGFHKKPADIIADNNLITINLLKYGHDRVKRFIYLSSSMVYETSRSYPHREEETDILPVMRTAYGLSKYIGERVVQSYQQQFGINYVIWRPFNIITPFEKPEEEGFSHVFADMIEKILVRKLSPVPVLGDGEQIRCFTNIHDVADAIALYSLRSEVNNEAVNIGNPEPTTVKELATKIVELGKKLGLLEADYKLAFEHQPVYADDVKKRIPDVSKIKKLFSWEAKIRVGESLEQCIRFRFELQSLAPKIV
ncbi:MAG TPA: NAD-dependent epimerase/dehydratase family protein [Chthoniobacterales bacterium]|jgi:UDP-glucose 4-epimerase|nr:NAD-dependent epimerase/dehydratase family protein [Chthoniobacterales bacterium]